MIETTTPGALHPAVYLILLSGLTIFWVIPAAAWFLVRSEQDRAATQWFVATFVYASAASIFVLFQLYPSLSVFGLAGTLATISGLLFISSIRREYSKPLALPEICSVVLVDVCIFWAGYAQIIDRDAAVAMHLALISALEILLIYHCWKVRILHQSRSLWILILVFSIFALSNITRISEFISSGQLPRLLDFSSTGSAALIVNYVSVVFYSFGYWGFVIEKTKAREAKARAESIIEAEKASIAEERNKLLNQHLIERTALTDKLIATGKIAQSNALTALISHQINQPLSSLHLTLENLIDLQTIERTNTEKPELDLARKALSSVTRISELITGIRTLFSKSTNYTQVDINQIIEHVLELLEQSISKANVLIETSLKSKQQISVNSGEIEHVAISLLQNALEKKYPSTRRVVSIATRDSEHGVVLSVTDNGCSIAKVSEAEMFELAISTKPNGAGLGLWLSKSIVEQYGGSIVLARNKDNDVCFEVNIPAQQ